MENNVKKIQKKQFTIKPTKLQQAQKQLMTVISNFFKEEGDNSENFYQLIQAINDGGNGNWLTWKTNVLRAVLKLDHKNNKILKIELLNLLVAEPTLQPQFFKGESLHNRFKEQLIQKINTYIDILQYENKKKHNSLMVDRINDCTELKEITETEQDLFKIRSKIFNYLWSNKFKTGLLSQSRLREMIFDLLMDKNYRDTNIVSHQLTEKFMNYEELHTLACHQLILSFQEDPNEVIEAKNIKEKFLQMEEKMTILFRENEKLKEEAQKRIQLEERLFTLERLREEEFQHKFGIKKESNNLPETFEEAEQLVNERIKKQIKFSDSHYKKQINTNNSFLRLPERNDDGQYISFNFEQENEVHQNDELQSMSIYHSKFFTETEHLDNSIQHICNEKDQKPNNLILEARTNTEGQQNRRSPMIIQKIKENQRNSVTLGENDIITASPNIMDNVEERIPIVETQQKKTCLIM